MEAHSLAEQHEDDTEAQCGEHDTWLHTEDEPPGRLGKSCNVTHSRFTGPGPISQFSMLLAETLREDLGSLGRSTSVLCVLWSIWQAIITTLSHLISLYIILQMENFEVIKYLHMH